MDRRVFLLQSGLTVAGANGATAATGTAGAGGVDAVPHSPSRPTSPGASLDFENYVRVRASLDAEPVFERIAGWTYGLVPGEPPRLLWALEGLSVTRCSRVAAERVSARFRYLGLLRDPLTGARLQRFENPYTGARLEAPVSSYGPAELLLTPRGGLPAGLPEAKTPMSAVRLGEWLTFTDHVLPPLAAEFQPKLDVVSFTARAADAFDSRLNSAPANWSFSAAERWRRWMNMGDRAGSLFWHVTGAKVRLEDVPAELGAIARERWGGLDVG